LASPEKIPPSPHEAAERRRQNHSRNDGGGDLDEPLLAFHPAFMVSPYPVARIQREALTKRLAQHHAALIPASSGDALPQISASRFNHGHVCDGGPAIEPTACGKPAIGPQIVTASGV
jgi:hypothetical protein